MFVVLETHYSENQYGNPVLTDCHVLEVWHSEILVRDRLCQLAYQRVRELNQGSEPPKVLISPELYGQVYKINSFETGKLRVMIQCNQVPLMLALPQDTQ
jgi:hypothetical protein